MIEITIPTLHAGQAKIYHERARRNAVRCGRRFGKTKMMVSLAADGAIRGLKIGLFAPEHKQLQEPYDELVSILHPMIVSASRAEGTIKLTGGGKVDLWRLIDNELAGRGREYDRVLVDEAAFSKNPQMMEIWQKSIMPTMATKPRAEVWAFSTPNGNSPDNFFYKICKEPDYGFKEFHATSASNPLVSPEWLEAEREKAHPDVFRQEYLAEFVDWSGTAFFSLDHMLVEGQPVDVTWRTDQVYAVVDTASKDGAEHDGTGVIYFARSKYAGHPLMILDWDVIQIEASLLIDWVPTIATRLEELARETNARQGSVGIWIEDKDSGIALLQSGRRRGLPVEPIDGQLTSQGKEGRAISVSGYVYHGDVKIARHAFDKVKPYRGQSRNHLIDQVCGFRMGQNKRDHRKDLLDCYTYGIAIGLGNTDGY